MRFRTIRIRVAEPFRVAPAEYIQLLGSILLNKIFRQPVDREERKKYRSFLEEHILPHQQPRTYNVSDRYSPRGKAYNLDHLFNRLNQNYFENQLQKPILGWSLKRSRKRLGFYSKERNLLVISRIFDSAKIPIVVLENLLYHEMLHIFFPVAKKNGRRRIHPPEFKNREKKFPGYPDSQRWLTKHLPYLR